MTAFASSVVLQSDRSPAPHTVCVQVFGCVSFSALPVVSCALSGGISQPGVMCTSAHTAPAVVINFVVALSY